jgi:hypothetical protein
MSGEKMRDDQRHDQSSMPRLDEESFSVEMAVGTEHSFYEVLLEAVEEAFSSLGEPVVEKIFCTLEKSFGIRRSEIPCRIEDFSDALEKIFGLGALQLEISVVKRLHIKGATEYKWAVPQWIVRELTFKEYVNMAKQDFEGQSEIFELSKSEIREQPNRK